MKKIFYLILIILVTVDIYGQDKYLNPCIDFGGEIEQINKYNQDLETLINSRFKQDYLIRFIAKPSFSSEYSFQIEKDSLNYMIKTIMFQENIWYSKNRDSIKLNFTEMIIDSLMVKSIDRLYDKITSSAMNRKEWIGGGEDGETYLFYKTTNVGLKNCGECWSPSEGTPLFELVSICNSLIDKTEKKNADFENVIERINLLYDKIE